MSDRKVLILANCELGLSNVFLATTCALRSRDPRLQVHVASFAPLQKRISKLNALPHLEDSQPVVFHEVPGTPMMEVMNNNPDVASSWVAACREPPGFWTTPHANSVVVSKGILSWEPEEFADAFTKISGIIQVVRPDAVLVDPTFAIGLTAVQHERKTNAAVKFPIILLAPNSLKEYVQVSQPGATLWTWPALGSGLPMPLKKRHVPLNIYLVLRMFGSVVMDKEIKRKISRIQELVQVPDLAIETNMTIHMSQMKGYDAVIVGNRPEIDFPNLDLTGMPKAYLDKLFAPGPIIVPAPPLSEVDATLLDWLAPGNVVYINLGSLCGATEPEAIQMATAIVHLLSARGREADKLRVLWKLKQDLNISKAYGTGPGSQLYDVIGPWIEKGNVKIVDWLEAEPVSILATGKIICSVNHGGAGTFSEAVCFGIPQVVLPVWTDCFDYANRVEMLGIGRWGSKEAKPRWKAEELARALVDVVLDRNNELSAKTKALSEICGGDSGGRDQAARLILETMTNWKESLH
ncbi:hypothetical protein NQ176_g4916 [Zarea fungicola]|uniref:Uncharacterized protein n=1 Tax=Zarea fungicola TaxID=93591 RepID=A0ACC1NC97_9HYPO|nr:hypothetical protein NQ176_g4916 [Lecanicillium fungicola]